MFLFYSLELRTKVRGKMAGTSRSNYSPLPATLPLFQFDDRLLMEGGIESSNQVTVVIGGLFVPKDAMPTADLRLHDPEFPLRLPAECTSLRSAWEAARSGRFPEALVASSVFVLAQDPIRLRD